MCVCWSTVGKIKNSDSQLRFSIQIQNFRNFRNFLFPRTHHEIPFITPYVLHLVLDGFLFFHDTLDWTTSRSNAVNGCTTVSWFLEAAIVWLSSVWDLISFSNNVISLSTASPHPLLKPLSSNLQPYPELRLNNRNMTFVLC